MKIEVKPTTKQRQVSKHLKRLGELMTHMQSSSLLRIFPDEIIKTLASDKWETAWASRSRMIKASHMYGIFLANIIAVTQKTDLKKLDDKYFEDLSKFIEQSPMRLEFVESIKEASSMFENCEKVYVDFYNAQLPKGNA